ncbi:anaphase-promoting complex subunit 10 [Cimex lectularius]|uniref:Anaphase-promoting complex subunit 10 n=1 Tax=Cimex lectularius TaxID=79782 RepID=A0A8I6RCB7_CIMLE|nr:anaphase-promoting complex subunit 10 [Cimex lectularius]
MEKEDEKQSETKPAENDLFRDVRLGKLREVGSQSIWSLSSCKPGFGVDQLRDDLLDTYWQSDGGLPHLVSIQFRRKTTVSDVCIYTDFKLDESYTPSRVSIRAGTSYNDIQEIEVLDLHEPAGWIVIPVKDAKAKQLRTFMIQIAIMSNHQNGRDTHIRQIKIHSPVERSGLMPLADSQANFQTVNFLQYSCIR